MKKALDILSTKRLRSDRIVTHTLPLDKIKDGIMLSSSGEALKVYISNPEKE
jgi:Zn-dependent alcohol dehydrogenase